MSATIDQPHAPPPAGRTVHNMDGSAALLEFVNSRINFERLPVERYDLQDFKLDRMRELLSRLGNPQDSLPAVHIAGTKGKGSTAAMTAAVMTAGGYRVGLFTSPHLDNIGERMTVDGQLPSEDDLRELMKIVPPIVQQMDALGPSMRPTFFECITAMAWMHFARQRVDLVVLEVGLGGRLDASNVCCPLVTIITSISHDHQRLLGHTLGEIASEKAGIIKAGVPVLSGVIAAEPREVIRTAAARQEAALYELGRELRWTPATASVPISPGEQGVAADLLEHLTICTHSPWGQHEVRVPLPGRHQADNALLALTACDLLAESRFPLRSSAIPRGLASVSWPLRGEVLSRRPLVVVDAAHNDGSIDCLIATLAGVHCRRRWLIFATSKDKDTADMLGRLNQHFDDVILTQFLGNPRSVPLEALIAMAAETLTIPFSVAGSPDDAWKRARSMATDEDLICATGSFFLAAEMRTVVLSERGVLE
ncbi:MAG: bifunctional folylpolyglutamate synthase/dihydrofolate synthase [Planctomycetaceae bacterium]|nr:bifunctional folylpolyglutamate synthase/dihydrofolate synthase [Planctomycetaceae bacterium]